MINITRDYESVGLEENIERFERLIIIIKIHD